MRQKIFVLTGIFIAAIFGVSLMFMRYSSPSRDTTEESARNFEQEYREYQDKIIDAAGTALEVMGELTDGRLNPYEIVSSFTSLYDTLLGRNIVYNRLTSTTFMMDKSPVRAAYSMIEDSRAVRGKLSPEEKLLYAYLAVYITEKGTENLTADVLKDSMKSERERSPEKFAFYDRERRLDSVSADFGVTRENPVRAVSIGHSYRYISRLRTPSGEHVSYSRIGSMEGTDGGIIDAYSLEYKDGSDDKKIVLYIDPYCAENSHKAPEGLIYSN